MHPRRPAAALAASALAIAACQDLQLVHVGQTGTSNTGPGGAGGQGSSSTSSSSSSSSASSTSSSATSASGCNAGSTASSSGGVVLLGDTNVEPYTDFHDPGLADISSFVAVADGTVHKLGVYYDSGDTTQLLIGLYDDAGGQPNQLLTQGSVASPTAGTWVTAPVAAATVKKSSTYWIVLLSPLGQGHFNFRYIDGACGDTKHSPSSPAWSALPAQWASGDDFPNTMCSFFASE